MNSPADCFQRIVALYSDMNDLRELVALRTLVRAILTEIVTRGKQRTRQPAVQAIRDRVTSPRERVLTGVPEWRNWQTRRTQNPVRLTSGGGSIPPSGTKLQRGYPVKRPTAPSLSGADCDRTVLEQSRSDHGNLVRMHEREDSLFVCQVCHISARLHEATGRRAFHPVDDLGRWWQR